MIEQAVVKRTLTIVVKHDSELPDIIAKRARQCGFTIQSMPDDATHHPLVGRVFQIEGTVWLVDDFCQKAVEAANALRKSDAMNAQLEVKMKLRRQEEMKRRRTKVRALTILLLAFVALIWLLINDSK